MLRVGDYATWMSRLGGTVTGRVTAVIPGWVGVDDGTVGWYCPLEEVHKIETPIPNEDIVLDEFDEGGLKKMPDGTLESVHIPGPEAEKEKMIYIPEPKKPEEEEAVEGYPILPQNPEFRDAMKKLQRWAAEEEMKLPYTATGTGGPPKPKPPVLEWKVGARFGHYPGVNIELYVNGERFGGKELDRPKARDLTARQERKLAKKIAEAKESILRLYRLTLRESGRVE